MWTSRVSAKGQVTLPKPVRDEMGIAPGGEVTFERLPSGELVVRTRHESALALSGMLSRYAKSEPVSAEELSEAVAQASADRHRSAGARAHEASETGEADHDG
jgi:AbrB family looped-hinge helix DNA binding protein